MVVLSLWLSIFIPTIISIKNYWAWAVSGIICASLTIYVMRIKNLAEFISGRKDDKEEKSR
jgi:tetrahydromethanopterin S-methyltransferase subunit E